jgi:hypothetical protein
MQIGDLQEIVPAEIWGAYVAVWLYCGVHPSLFYPVVYAVAWASR